MAKIKPRKGETVAAAYQRARDEELAKIQAKPMLFKPVPGIPGSPKVVGMVRKPYG